jgi:hypothetical protein
MTSQPEELAGLLNMGTIFVEIELDEALGGLTAKTMNDMLFGPVELGFELTVSAIDLDYYEDAYDERTPEQQAQKIEELVREVLEGMRLALARCFLFGKMRPGTSGMLDEQTDRALDKVLAEKDEEYFLITLRLTQTALQEQANRDEAFMGFLNHMGELMESQQASPDENITIGEALDRQEKGAEQVRKIVDGDEPEEEG